MGLFDRLTKTPAQRLAAQEARYMNSPFVQEIEKEFERGSGFERKEGDGYEIWQKAGNDTERQEREKSGGSSSGAGSPGTLRNVKGMDRATAVSDSGVSLKLGEGHGHHGEVIKMTEKADQKQQEGNP